MMGPYTRALFNLVYPRLIAALKGEPMKKTDFRMDPSKPADNTSHVVEPPTPVMYTEVAQMTLEQMDFVLSRPVDEVFGGDEPGVIAAPLPEKSAYIEPTETKKSTHKVEVVPLVLEKHDNADTLSIARIYGFTCVTNTVQWEGKDRAAYLPPDSLVDVNRPEFSFLAKDAKSDGKARIKAKKIRGVLSFGLLVPAPAGAEIGDDVAGELGVEHYEPAPKSEQNNRGGLFTGGEVAKAPDVYVVKYDLEAGRRYAEQVFEKGELCLVSEKLHGASARYVFLDGQMHCGSRNEWKKEYPNYDHVTVESLVATGKVTEERAQEIVAKLKDGDHPLNMWWQALLVTPSLRQFCENNPGTVVYGEVYGCQDLNYGLKKGVVKFAAFDAMKDGRWLDATEFYPLMVNAGVPTVPFVAGLSPFERPGDARPDDVVGIPFDFDKICELAEGKTLIPGADHVREGVVVAPIAERYHQKLGRVKLKWVGAGYLERSK